MISATFQENFGILVVEKRHATNEHFFRQEWTVRRAVRKRLILLAKIYGVRSDNKNRRLQTMKKRENIFKRKDGRWEARYIKGYELSGKNKYGFCYGKTYKEAKEKFQNTRRLCLQANRHRRPAHDIALLFLRRMVALAKKQNTGIRQRGIPSEDTSNHPLPFILVSYRSLSRLDNSFCSISVISFFEGNKKADRFLISICLAYHYSVVWEFKISNKGKTSFLYLSKRFAEILPYKQ